MAEQIFETLFRVEGMDCASCASKIENVARSLDGINDVNVSVMSGKLRVKHGPSADLEGLVKKIGKLGYMASPDRSSKGEGLDGEQDNSHNHSHDVEHGPWWASSKAKLTIVCGLAVAAAFAVATIFPFTDPWGYIAAMTVGLVPIARRAAVSAVNGMPFTIETLMSIAAIGALFIDASEEAAVVVFLFLVGELLEGVAAGRARSSIQALGELVPQTALLLQNGITSEVQASSLNVGALVLVRPGDRLPADGVIVEGISAINEAPVTGESMPKRKETGDTVFAGTINEDGQITIEVTAAQEDNTIARVVKLVEEAQDSKAPTQRFIDRFSKYYTPGVIVFAILVASVPPVFFGGNWSEWVYKGLAVILIGCPCALVISTPAAIAASLASGARRGLLMKGGAVLETLGKITIVAFDKTGTLTEGRPKVTEIIAGTRESEDVLRLAATLEAGSSHPLAVSILEKASQQAIKVRASQNSRAVAGKGVEGTIDGINLFLGSPSAASEMADIPKAITDRIEVLNSSGNSVAVLVGNGEVIGAIAMRDEPRQDAIQALQKLSDLEVRAVMLTGDNARTASAIAEVLGIECRSELLPDDKQKIVSELKSAGEWVAKVGDGINDAPALAMADVGIAMGGGTDVALETADAAALHARVMDVPSMIALSRGTMRNIIQNITIALGLKAVFLVTTVLGITGLWPAILADTGATVLVTLNAMRLLRWNGIEPVR